MGNSKARVVKLNAVQPARGNSFPIMPQYMSRFQITIIYFIHVRFMQDCDFELLRDDKKKMYYIFTYNLQYLLCIGILIYSVSLHVDVPTLQTPAKWYLKILKCPFAK